MDLNNKIKGIRSYEFLTQSKKQEIYNNIAIATTTFYNPDSEIGRNRQGLAEKLVRNATDLGCDITVVDGGSSDEFLRTIDNYGARIFAETERGMSPSRRQAMKRAYDTGKLIQSWIEPEKEHYVRGEALLKTAIPIWEKEADLVIPDARIMTHDGYHLPGYPTSQKNEELYGNDCWRELTGTDLDIWRGPRTEARKETHYFLEYDGKNNFCKRNGKEEMYGDKWDSIFLPVMQAILDGKRVIGIKVDYHHPKEQTEFEEGNYVATLKRLDQLTNLVPAFTDYWEKNYLNSKLRAIREGISE